MSTINVRVDPKMALFVERLAHATGRSKSDIVREALESLHARQLKSSKPAEALAGLIGSWDSGGLQLSDHTGERFAQLLSQRERRRDIGRRRSTRRTS